MNNRLKPTIFSSSAPGTDEALVSAAKNGNQRAFEVLVERHRQRMLAFARRYTRVREDAEDVVQQTFQKAFIHLNKFQGKSSFSTWLTRIAINEALMLMRRSHALREIPVNDSSDPGSRCISNGDTRCKSGPRNQLLAAGESANPVRHAWEFAARNADSHRVAGTRRVINRGDCPAHGYLSGRRQSTALPCEKEVTRKIEPLSEVQFHAYEKHYRRCHGAHFAKSPLQCVWPVRKTEC